MFDRFLAFSTLIAIFYLIARIAIIYLSEKCLYHMNYFSIKIKHQLRLSVYKTNALRLINIYFYICI